VKVLLVGTGAHPIPPTGYGAIERILFEYGQALAAAGHSVRIVNEVNGKGPLAEYRFAYRLPSLLRGERYEVVHASTPVVANRLAAAGIPYVYTSHSRHWFWRENWRHRWGYWLERRAVRRAAAVVALTVDVAAAMRATLPPDFSSPLRVIPYGVNFDGYGPAWEQRTGHRALGVGLVLPLKGWEIASAGLKGTGVSLRIAGPVLDRSYASRVRSAGDSVELLGEVDEVPLRQLYAESDLLVHPSRVEVLPRAVVEAMASALPVIGSSAVNSLFPGGTGGLIAPQGATDDQSIRFFRDSTVRLASSATLRRELGEAGRNVARSTYAWDRVVAAHLELYRQVVAGTSR
jgi:glycosyltransferase involved in cell wall biosynthesis